MSKLEYRKKIKIEYKVVKENDILQIARLFQDQFEENDYEREISLYFSDDSQISGQDIDVFTADEFKRRLCKIVRFSYASKGFEKRLEIWLYNTAIFDVVGKVEIISSDKGWYDSIINRITTLFGEVEKQKPVEKYIYFAVGSLSVLEAILFSLSLTKVFSNIFTAGTMPYLSCGSTMLFFLINWRLADQLSKAYPKVEFAFGPEHLNSSKKIRKIVGIIIPFVVDVVFFVLGLLLG